MKKTLIISISFIISGLSVFAQSAEWNEQYYEMADRVNKHENKPPPSETQLEEYLYWMGVHAVDRDDISKLIETLENLYNEDPNEDYITYRNLFINLRKKAERSGDRALGSGSFKLLRVTERSGEFCGWFTSLWKTQNPGRKLFNKALETKFDASIPKDYVECLLNNAIIQIEANKVGDGLYYERELVCGYVDEDGYTRFWEEFNIECEPRDRFFVRIEGTPMKTIPWAFENVNTIREECKWWNFNDLYNDATDLMNRYYKDVLCELPPHKQKHGHRFFHELAVEYDLEESIRYNEGFYGKVYGKVEIMDQGTTFPAKGATVYISDIDDLWVAETDANGNYEIPKAILHKDCSPFEIRAHHKGDWVDDTYEGILIEPDTNASLRKDLTIIRNREYKWHGSLSIIHSESMNCTDSKEHEDDATISRKLTRIEKLNANIKVKGEEILEFGLGMLTEDNMVASGNLQFLMKSEYETENQSTDSYGYNFSSENGQDIMEISSKDIIIQIFKDQTGNTEVMAEEIEEAVAEGFNDPDAIDAMMKKMEEAFSGQNENEVPVQVIIRLTKVKPTTIDTYQYSRTDNGGNPPTVKEEEGSYEVQVPILLSYALKGTYIKDDNGEDKLIATFEESKLRESSYDCTPQGTTTNSYKLELVRRRIK